MVRPIGVDPLNRSSWFRSLPERRGAIVGEMDFMDEWYPIQVKQTAKVGRPDIDAFEAVMIREERTPGYFVGFDFTGMKRPIPDA